MRAKQLDKAVAAELPTYPWFDQVPTGLLTRRQLSERGLKPGGPVRAQVVWRTGFANLFPESEAVAKRPVSAAQREVLQRGRHSQQVARQTIEEAWRREKEERQREREERQKEREEALRQQIKQDHLDAIASAQSWLELGERAVIVDLETTDLEGEVEAVEVGAIDLSGGVLYHSLVKPRSPVSEGAQRVHGITNEELAAAPSFGEVWPHLRSVLSGRILIAYNSSFDRSVLVQELHRLFAAQAGPLAFRRQLQTGQAAFNDSLLERAAWRCAMQVYAEFVGNWSTRHGSYTWLPLPNAGHRALGDCLATLQLLRTMAAAAPNESSAAVEWAAAEDLHAS